MVNRAANPECRSRLFDSKRLSSIVLLSAILGLGLVLAFNEVRACMERHAALRLIHQLDDGAIVVGHFPQAEWVDESHKVSGLFLLNTTRVQRDGVLERLKYFPNLYEIVLAGAHDLELEELECLTKVSSLQSLSLEGATITDNWVPTILRMSRLQSLSGTDIRLSDESMRLLVDRQIAIAIDD